MNIDAAKLREILNGKWIVPPPTGWKFDTVTISKQQCQLEKGKSNLFIAIDEKAWHEGSGNKGIYAGWQDTHRTVYEFADTLSGIIVQRPVDNIDETIPQLLVDNTYEAIKELAIVVRENFTGKVVAITGTAGKSSTKNLLDNVLTDKGNVITTRGNHNTRTGVPLTMACGVTNPDYMILETAISALWMQTGGIGKISKPHISIITSIGGGQQKTPLETATLKAKVCEGMVPGGFAILNKDMLHFQEVKDEVEQYGAKVVTYGKSEDAHVFLIESIPKQGSTYVKVNVFGEVVEYDVPLLGEGMVLNTLAVLAAVKLLDANIVDASNRFESFKGNKSVLQFESIEHYKGGAYTLIDDAWNATELSMLEAIDILKQQKQFHNGRSIAVLGRIENLGGDAKRQHKRMVQPLINSGVDLVFAHGPEMKYVLDDLPFDLIGGYYEDAPNCARAVTQFIEPGDLVLLKGSPRASDFKHMKRQLKSNAKKNQTVMYKSLGNHLAKQHGAITISLADEKVLSAIGGMNVVQKQGIGNILLLSLVLDNLLHKKIHVNDTVIVSRQAALESKSPRSISLKEGEEVKLHTLLEAFIVRDAPNAMLAVAAHVYRSSNHALKHIQSLAERLSINSKAVKNVTGRTISNKTQSITINDLYKAAKYLFNRLPHELALLNRTSMVFKNKELMSLSNLIDSQVVSHSFMYGHNGSIGMSLTKINHRKCISIVVGARDAFHRDYLITKSIDDAINETKIKQNAIQPTPITTENKEFKVNILADTYFGEFYTDIRKRRNVQDALTKYNYNYSFRGIRSILQQGDFNIANFEAALTEEKESRLKPIKPFVLYANPQLTVSALKREGINAVTLGNNHLMDFEEKGLKETLNRFREMDIDTFGAGKNSEEAEKPYVQVINGKRIVYFSAYWYRHTMHRKFNFYATAIEPGVACLSGDLIEQIKTEKRNHPESKVVVFAHWGVDFKVVQRLQRRYAHVLVDAGADLILGHGAHMMQEIEKVKDSWIVYSLGNGVFNSNGEYALRHAPPYSFIAQLHIMKQHNKLRLYPIYSDNLATFWQSVPVNERQFHHLLDIQKSYGLHINSHEELSINQDSLGFFIEINL